MPSDPGSDTEEKQSRPLDSAAVKWIVLGAVIVVFLFLFKDEVGRLLDRTTGVSITGSGVEIKTLETPLGKAQVSVGKAESAEQGIHGNVYTNQQYKFRISWPDAKRWTADENVGRMLQKQMNLPATVDIPLVIVKNELVNGFRPNVNVLVEQVGAMSVDDYVRNSAQNLANMGWQVLTSGVDPATQAGLVVYINRTGGAKLYQFARIVIANDRAFVVTASQLPPDDAMNQQLRESLLKILNSFELLV